MKRTAMIAIVIAALTFGVVGFAVAERNEDVVVSATVNPAFDMTINQNAVSFGAVDVGASYSDSDTAIRVRSNKAWNFSKNADYSVTPEIAPYLTEATDVEAAEGLGHGVTDIVATYTLDLSTDAAYDLEAGDYEATFTYTAVQQ